MWKEYHEQYDIKYRLLSFLLQLSTNPISVDYSPRELSPEEEENNNINWIQLLREGEEPLEPLGSESELSEWSDDEESVSAKIDNNAEHSDDDTGDVPTQVIDDDHVEWMRENVQFPFWIKTQTVAVDSDEPSATLAEDVEKMRVKSGEAGVESVKMSEYQVLREVLWMLRSPTQSTMFHLNNNDQFEVTTLVTIPSLTDGVMKRLFSEVLTTINNVHQMRRFMREVETLPDLPRTFESYTESLNIFLDSFSNELFEVETELMKQDDTMTMMSVLDSLNPWFKMVQSFYKLHGEATSHWKQSENWLKSIRLLSVVFNHISTNHLSSIHPFILDTFLRSIQPYLSIIHTWLEEGRLEDWRQEFIFYKDTHHDKEDPEQFWSQVFLIHPFKEKLEAERVAPLRLLRDVDNKIFVSGKSIEILSRLDLKAANLDEVSASSEELFDKFLENIRKNLPSTIEDNEKESLDDDKTLDPDLQSLVDSSDDQFLALAFTEIFAAAQQTKDMKKQRKFRPKFLLSGNVDILHPLESILKRSLTPLIDTHYNRACSRLLELFKTELELETTLSRARKVFFMEAGDLMHDFCSQLFKIVETGDRMELEDSASLTLLLQDCLGGRYPGWCDLFSCSYQPPDNDQVSLTSLSVHLSVSWPLNIVLTQHNLDIYNRVFLFLAEVKRSLWSLQCVSLADLADLEDRMEAGDDLSMSCLSVNQTLSDSSLCPGVKQHRLQLLRSWLIYFTSTVHGYFMTRVVHSTELELKENLEKATDLDQIISVHETYLQRIHDRCFLHPSVSMLREAVVMVLNIGLEVRQCVVSGQPIHSRIVIGWEEKYRNCHHFLAKTLKSMTKKRKVPHLEGLAVALLHSCPA